MANQNKRNCQIKEHLNNQVFDICIYPMCEQETRWVCMDCIKESFHSHGQANIKHVINASQSVVKLKQNINNLEKQDYNEISQRIKQIKQILNQIIILAQENIKILETHDPLRNIRPQIEYYNDLIERIEQKGYFQQLSNEEINLLVENQTNQYIKVEEIINKIIGNLDKQVQKIGGLNPNKPQIIRQIEDYQNNIITVHKQNTQITCAALSNNEQIFAYLMDKKLKLVSPFSQLQYIIDNSDPITCCQFTECSKYLIYGDAKGKVFRLPINLQNMNPLSMQVCKTPIINLVSKNHQNTFITNQDNQIIKICLETNRCLFQKSIDVKMDSFDYSQRMNIIVIICFKLIQIRDGEEGKILMTQKDSHQYQINQIMLTQNLLFTLDQVALKIWNIDNNALYQKHLISAEQQIFNFSQINDKQILLLCQDKMVIKDFNNNQIGQHDHKNNIQRPFCLKQPSSLKFSVIIQNQISFLFKGQNQMSIK